MKENRMKKILCTVIIWLFANENFAMANKEVEGTIFLNEAGQKISYFKVHVKRTDISCHSEA